MHLHNMKHTVLMSPADSKLIEGIRSIGIEVVFSECIEQLRTNERYHADMQLLIIKDTAFLPENCSELTDRISAFGYKVVICSELENEYPNNVGLNAALVGNRLLCKKSALDAKIVKFCEDYDIEIINVNQGYAKCSALVVNDNALVTSDKTIYEAATANGIRALKIRSGHIHLDDADYGFIGGCSGVIGDKVIFFGDVRKHPDSALIYDFLRNEGVGHICISDDMMNDIGGLVLLK